MASVRKRKWTHDGVEKEAWVVSYTDQGGKRRIKTFDKKKDADKHRTVVEVEIEKGVHTPDAETLTIRRAYEAVDRDLDRRAQDGDLSRSHLRSFRSVMKVAVLPELGAIKLNELKVEDVRTIIDRAKVTHSAHHVHRIYKSIQALVDFAASPKRGWVKRNCLREERIKLPPKEKRVAVPSKADLESLLAQTDVLTHGEHLQTFVQRKLMVVLGLFGGLRPGEVSGLQWSDVDVGANVLRIRHSFTNKLDGLRSPKTSAGVRAVPITPPIRKALDDAARVFFARKLARSQVTLSGRRCNHRSFTARAISPRERQYFFEMAAPVSPWECEGFVMGLPVDAATRAELWPLVMKRARLWDDCAKKPKFTPHALRHAAASLWIENGMPEMNLTTLIGHRSIKTTYDVYGHLFPEDRRTFDITEQVAAMLSATTARHEPLNS